jgi:hypothetical protein
VIHAFALEPKLVATWGRREEFRFIYDKFGIGTPRVLLELPTFTKWKRDVFAAANAIELSQQEMLNLTELFRIFADHKCRRADAVYDGLLSWLENAEREYDRKEYAAIAATENPRSHHAVIVGDHLDTARAKWALATGATVARTPAALATALAAMLINCRELHFIDPHFGPENARHRKVLEMLTDVMAASGRFPEVLRVHSAAKSDKVFFEQHAAKMAKQLSHGCAVEFVRWKQRQGSEKLHNRYVLTDLGGVALGVGLDEGEAGETDDLLLLPRAQFQQRWLQYASDSGPFERVDTPCKVFGSRRTGQSRARR